VVANATLIPAVGAGWSREAVAPTVVVTSSSRAVADGGGGGGADPPPPPPHAARSKATAMPLKALVVHDIVRIAAQ